MSFCRSFRIEVNAYLLKMIESFRMVSDDSLHDGNILIRESSLLTFCSYAYMGKLQCEVSLCDICHMEKVTLYTTLNL